MFCCNPFKGGKRREEAWSEMCRVKVVVVGDARCGKTSLVRRHCCGTLPAAYTPTLFDTNTVNSEVDGKKVQMVVQDTAGQEDLKHLRPPCYLHTDVIIVCFTPDSEESWDSIRKVWVPEVRRYCGKRIPILLVANKVDLAAAPLQQQYPNDSRLGHSQDIITRNRHPNSDCVSQDNHNFRDSQSSTSSSSSDHIRSGTLSSSTVNRDSGLFCSTEHLVKSVTREVKSVGHEVQCVRDEEKRSLFGRSCSRVDKLIHAFGERKTQPSGGRYGSMMQEGQSLASQIGAVGYFQTSAVLNQGTEQVFQAALTAAMSSKQWRKKYRL